MYFVAELGLAAATFYHRRGINTISLSYDCRLSSARFKELISFSLTKSGINVIDLGLGPTPLVYFSLFNLPVGGGIMITGSHNPPRRKRLQDLSRKNHYFWPKHSGNPPNNGG